MIFLFGQEQDAKKHLKLRKAKLNFPKYLWVELSLLNVVEIRYVLIQ